MIYKVFDFFIAPAIIIMGVAWIILIHILKTKFSFKIVWRDLWIGLYYDRILDTFYICPLPCCVFIFSRSTDLDCKTCNAMDALHAIQDCENCTKENRLRMLREMRDYAESLRENEASLGK